MCFSSFNDEYKYYRPNLAREFVFPGCYYRLRNNFIPYEFVKNVFTRLKNDEGHFREIVDLFYTNVKHVEFIGADITIDPTLHISTKPDFIFKLPKNINMLTITNDTPITDDQLQIIVAKFPLLSLLEIRDGSMLTNRACLNFARNFSRLEHLSIERYTHFDISSIFDLFELEDKLRTMAFSGGDVKSFPFEMVMHRMTNMLCSYCTVRTAA